jgi:hypothetical protein
VGKPSSIAHLGQPGLLWGIEPDVEGPEVVVELSQAASSHNRCGDSGLSRVRASATREGLVPSSAAVSFTTAAMSSPRSVRNPFPAVTC